MLYFNEYCDHMDNITQWVIWWSLYTLITKKHRPKHFFLGAGIANIPDLDVFISRLLPLSPIDANFFHRGIMHSIVFNVWIALWVGYILYRSDKSVPYRRYVLAVFVSILFGHLLVDGMTTYGMRYFLPRSGQTYSTDNVFVVDFWAWVITIGGLVVYLFSQVKKKIAQAILILVGIYFACTFALQAYVHEVFRSNYWSWVNIGKTMPEPFQPFLWRHIVQTPAGYYAGYYSVFDSDKHIEWKFYPDELKNWDEIRRILSENIVLKNEFNKIYSFSRGYLRVIPEWSGYRLENMLSWPLLGREDGNDSAWTFNFHLQSVDNIYILSQSRGFEREISTTIWKNFWKRVWGNK